MKIPFTKEHEEVLPYTIDPYLKHLLIDYSEILRELVHFGSHVLSWDTSKKREGKDIHVSTLFLRNILELVDGISILIRSSSIDPAKLLARSLFETNLNLFYLIEKDEKLRTKCFMVWQTKNQIKYHKKFLSEERSSKDMVSKLTKGLPEMNISAIMDRDETKEFINRKVQLLNSDRFKEVSIEYEKTRKRLKNKTTWYSLYNGPSSIEKLANHFNLNLLYEFMYREYSKFTHSNHITKGFAFVHGVEDAAQIIQIRDFKDCKKLTAQTVGLALDGIIKFIHTRLPEKNDILKEWYLRFKENEKTIFAKEFKYSK